MAGLFDPIKIKGLELKNRIIMAPMATGMATPDGRVTERHIKHYSARARGGVGLVIIEHTFVTPEGRLAKNQLGLYKNDFIQDLARLVEAIHQGGAKVVIQLTHAGAVANSEVTGHTPVGPSSIPLNMKNEIPKALSVSEISDIVEAFKEASRYAVIAGCDSVELHGAHGFLLNQFVSPYTNKRDDEYGGSLDNRMRFSVEVIGEVKEVLNNQAPLFYRFGADDLLEGGLTQDEGKEAAIILEKAGVDVLDVSGGISTGKYDFTEPGYFIPLAENIKKNVTIPVVGVGNINDPKYADDVLREQRVDLVAIGRKLLSDPDFAHYAETEISKGDR